MWTILRHNIFGNSVLGVITGVITLITPSHSRDHGERRVITPVITGVISDHTVITKYFYWGCDLVFVLPVAIINLGPIMLTYYCCCFI